MACAVRQLALLLATLTLILSVVNAAWSSENANTSYIDDYENSWSPWSEWSSCSRTCDGGAAYQLRRCNAVAGCKGHHVRYKICNMQPCPDGLEFRAVQCSAYNDRPYDDEIVEWHPYYDEESPCTLMCVDGKGRVEEMAPRVRDGTRCRPGSLDMCIDGVCQRVGCNLEIGSKASVDECGVCGGDGSSCSKDLYRWGKKGTGCSVSCGGGYEMSRVICQNRDTGAEVDADLCPGERPSDSDLTIECNSLPCPPKWVADDNWSPCSKTCGSGIRVRHVYCVEETNGTRTKVWHHMCHGHKPKIQEQCNTQPCYSDWMTGPWSKCSSTCGDGLQIRNITCKSKQKYLTCDPMTEPRRTKTCSTNIPCYPGNFEADSDFLGSSKSSFSQAHAQRLVVGQQKTSPHTLFVSDNWSPCSVTCGEGIRTRKVYCKAHLDYTQIMTKLTDDACVGPKPPEVEKCFSAPCSLNKIFDQNERSIRDGYADASSSDEFNPPKVAPGSFGKTYSWKREGFTHCSASCLGGVQESLVLCEREEDKKIVSPYLCSRNDQPEVLTQTCNDQPCPPRWNVSDFQPCSQSCGIGLQMREVNCIHEVTEGNTAIVPNNMCPQPAPTDRKQCNMIDCPAEWRTFEWSKCSKRCNGGVKTRDVKCVQKITHGHIVDRDDSECGSDKPLSSRVCNPNVCNTQDAAVMVSDVAQKYEQITTDEDVTLIVGGEATVYRGVEMKMQCPINKRGKIQWSKDDQELKNGKKVRILKKGILKIRTTTYSDRGTYTCSAGNAQATMNINIKPQPGEIPSSEEIDKPMNQQDPGVNPSYANAQGIEPAFDISHERIKGEHNREQKRKQSSRQKTTTRTAAETSTAASDKRIVETEKNALDVSPIPTTSGSSRNLPHLHSLLFNLKGLWPFQGFNGVSNARVNRMFMEEPATESETTTEEDMFGKPVLLGKGDRKSVKFEWVITEWSECSPPCGGNGFQMRAAHCMVKLHNTTQSVDNNLCEDALLPTPVTIQKCETEDCPQWSVSDWKPCEESKCFTWNTAMQRRNVYCQNSDGATISDAACHGIEKPVNRKECYNDQCKGTWKVGEWSECMASCEKDGLRYRILQCVWYGTNKPAGTACRDQPRPPVMKTCTGPPCAPKGECKDHSKHNCKNIRQMNMCHLRQYQTQCCHSCT